MDNRTAGIITIGLPNHEIHKSFIYEHQKRNKFFKYLSIHRLSFISSNLLLISVLKPPIPFFTSSSLSLIFLISFCKSLILFSLVLDLKFFYERISNKL